MADTSALKLFVGYDVLVLYRPQKVIGGVTAVREGGKRVITNGSNSAKELFDGEPCDPAGKNCQKLESMRLYAGAKWEQTLPYQTAVHYRETDGSGTRMHDF